MFGNHHCQRCDKSIAHAGICNDCEIARAMQFDLVPTGPAPKEERVEPTCNQCSDRLCLYEVERGICQQCINRKEAIAARKRRIYDRAFWAGIANDLCMEFAHRDALVIVRQWPAMQAELDALIGEMG